MPTRKPPMTAMGRRVQFKSPAKHPESTDPMLPPLAELSRLDIAGFDRNRPSAAGAPHVGDREARPDWVEGGPRSDGGGTESYNTARSKDGRLAGAGKRAFKRSDYGSGSVN